MKNLDYSFFDDNSINVLNTHASVKFKTIGDNNHEFMTKAHRKAMMARSRLKNVYLKNQNTTNWNTYKYQRNFCTNLIRKMKFYYFGNLYVKSLNSKKKFWKKIRLFFSDISLANCNIALKEKGNLIIDNQKPANLSNTYFINIINTSQFKKNHPLNLYLSLKLIILQES